MEQAIFTTLCMVCDDKGKVLVQERSGTAWDRIAFPDGHVEPGESFGESVICEVEEETGYRIKNPMLCGIKQFQTKNDAQYVILLYKVNQFTGILRPSNEGNVFWVEYSQMDCWVNKGAKGIELIDEKGSPNSGLWYVFDISDVHKARRIGRFLQLWEMKEEHQKAVLERLEQTSMTFSAASFQGLRKCGSCRWISVRSCSTGWWITQRYIRMAEWYLLSATGWKSVRRFESGEWPRHWGYTRCSRRFLRGNKLWMGMEICGELEYNFDR